jgi:hypothetical protein
MVQGTHRESRISEADASRAVEVTYSHHGMCTCTTSDAGGAATQRTSLFARTDAPASATTKAPPCFEIVSSAASIGRGVLKGTMVTSGMSEHVRHGSGDALLIPTKRCGGEHNGGRAPAEVRSETPASLADGSVGSTDGGQVSGVGRRARWPVAVRRPSRAALTPPLDVARDARSDRACARADRANFHHKDARNAPSCAIATGAPPRFRGHGAFEICASR